MEINHREVALDALLDIFTNKAYNNITLNKYLKQNGAMDKKNKAFVTEVVNGTLRNVIYLDYCINCFSNTKTEKMKPFILALLRSSTYQIFFMDKIPSSAVCNEAVLLAKKRGFSSLSGFVNAVLRKLSENKNNIPLPLEETDKENYLSVKYSFPLWIIKMWLHAYDYEFVKNLCLESNKAPKVSIICNTLKISPKDLELNLLENGIEIEKSKYFDYVFNIKNTSDITKLESFHDELFHIQDESSVIAINILKPEKNDRILDICAAPGGKSILSAELTSDLSRIYSRDIYEHKLYKIQENVERLSLNSIKTELKDALKFYEEDFLQYDKVIVDAPCSRFGIIRKKPDIKYNKTGEDIDNLIKIQRQILENAEKYVKPGGYLLYSTCTISKKENIKNAEFFAKNYNFSFVDISDRIPKNLLSNTAKDGYLELYPHIHGTDGFFIALFKKKD